MASSACSDSCRQVPSKRVVQALRSTASCQLTFCFSVENVQEEDPMASTESQIQGFL